MGPRRSRPVVRLLELGAAAATLGLGCGPDQRPAVWEYISPVIIQPSCATVSCHSRSAAVAGLDFSDPDRGYTSLTGLKVWVVDPGGTVGCRNMSGTVVCQRNFRPLVTPYNPEQSRIVNMLRARNATRMPPDRPLAAADIQLIEQWIRNGAPRHRPVADDGDGPMITVTVVDSAPRDGGGGDGAGDGRSVEAGSADASRAGD